MHWRLASAAVIAVVVVLAACSTASHDGTIALCASDRGALAIHGSDFDERRDRVLVAIDANGKRGREMLVGDLAACLGPAGHDVVIRTRDGVQVRDVKGNLVAKLADEVDFVAYDAHAHRLTYRSSEGVMIVDAVTRERWPAKAAPPASRELETDRAPQQTIAKLPNGGVTTAFYGGGDQAYRYAMVVDRYGLACDGEACRLGTRELDGYGNGTAVTPIAGAEVVPKPAAMMLVPAVGVLVADVKAIALIGFDGKIRWRLAGEVGKATRGWLLGDRLLLAAQDAESAPINYTPRATWFLVDNGKVVWTEVIERNTNWWDPDLTVDAARIGDTLLLGANAKIVVRRLR